MFEDEFNKDCVTVFRTDQQDNDDDDDEANVITATSTMVSIACTTHITTYQVTHVMFHHIFSLVMIMINSIS